MLQRVMLHLRRVSRRQEMFNRSRYDAIVLGVAVRDIDSCPDTLIHDVAIEFFREDYAQR